ncbi:MAG: 1-acyl-sn-glycerol-3-phosphate acyltransferase [Gammaproteobacteria bacterium]|nr:1-acyl-sn-glycerol-3-phosphate acyltransferase [Gammaproteobacteria bacterium]
MFWPRVAKLLLRLGRWTPVGPLPPVKKAVIIGAPHTSYWDGYWLVVYEIAYGFKVNFLVKSSMFWFPMSVLLKAMGGVALDRRDAGATVQQAVAAFNDNEEYLLGLAPEGTRGKTNGWKSGFYRIAEDAGVPVVFGFFDYANRRLGFGPSMMLSGDMDADMVIIRSFYESVTGHSPEKTCPVKLIRGKQRT